MTTHPARPSTQHMDRDLLQRVLEVSRLMAETRALAPLLDRVLEEAINLVGAEHGYLVMVDGHGSNHIATERHRDGRTAPQADDAISDSIVNRVVRTGKPLIVRDALNDPDFNNASSIINLKLRSVMCVPLISRGNLIGALYVENRSVSGRFKERDLPPLILFGNQAAVSIENASLNEELEMRVAQRTQELQATMGHLEQSWRGMVESNRLQTELLGNVAHDLRSPLTIVVGSLSAMQEGILGPVSEEQREWLAKCLDAVNHVISLTNDVFDLTKLDLGQLALYPKEVSLFHFLDNIFHIALGLPWPAEVRWEADIAADLPTVTLDPVRVRQVLFNLVTNAAKHTDNGTVKLHARYYPERSEVWVGVKDTGNGIAPEHLPDLFRRFQQVDPDLERRKTGTGLGLAISKDLIEMHGGRIWAESEPGKGSNFVFALPCPSP